jgi:hypothetical protein
MSNVTAPKPEAAPESKAAVELSMPAFRLNLMRGGYLLMAIGLTLVKWPLLPQVASLPAIDGAQICILTAVSLLAFLGVRYPIGMLPILVFEVLWKVLWLALVALPHLIANDLSGPRENLLFTILFVVPVIAVTPWDFVWKRFAATPGERWTRTR